MYVAIVAMVTIGAIVYFRFIGINQLQAQASKAEGNVLQARLRMGFILALCLGGLITLVGELTQIWVIRDLGIALWICSVPLLVARIIVESNGARSKTRK